MLVGFFFEGPFTKPPPPLHCCWSHISCFGSFCNLDCSRKGGGQSKYMTALYWFCHFSSISTNLSGRLGGKLAQFRSHTLMWFLNNLRLSQVEKKSRQKLEQGLTFHLHLLYLNFALLPPIHHICHNHHIQNWV